MAQVGRTLDAKCTPVNGRNDPRRYDFDLQTGNSETGLKACTYAIDIRTNDDGEDVVYVEAPEGGTHWRLVELRPVSEGEDMFTGYPTRFTQIAHPRQTLLTPHPHLRVRKRKS